MTFHDFKTSLKGFACGMTFAFLLVGLCGCENRANYKYDKIVYDAIGYEIGWTTTTVNGHKCMLSDKIGKWYRLDHCPDCPCRRVEK